MTFTASFRYPDIQFLRVQGDGLDPAALMMIDLMRWGVDNSPAIAVGLVLGATLSWVTSRIGAATY